MKSYAERAWAFIRKWWWAALGAIALIVGWVFLAPRGKKPQTKAELLKLPPETTVDSMRQIAVLEAERASVDAMIVKAKADTKTEEKQKQLDRIKSDPDPGSRRRRLARFGEQNL